MITIKSIAEAANCSVATVSKALNDRPDVAAATRQRILAIAKEFDFYPNALGKALKKKVTENVGVIFCREQLPLSLNPFYSRVLEGIEAELAVSNYNLVLHLLPESYTNAIPKMIREHQVDGLVLIGVLQQNFIDQLTFLEIPTVLVDPKITSNSFCQVLIDNEHGAFQAAHFLIDHGHTRIGFISGDLDRLSFRQRFDGYCKALEFARIPLRDELVKSGGLEKGYDHVSALLDLPDPPTAIFAANDINAIYGYKAITDHNLRIPEDISIIGFDDIELGKMISPPLSTVRVYKEQMGSIAVRTLFKVLNHEIEQPVTTMVPTRLIERESVANCRQG
jgi:DNA-binding LacI/PurR family transcriptional regulator